MKALTADTATSLFKAGSDCVITLISDSTTVTRLSKSQRYLTDNAEHGFLLTCYQPVIVRMRKDEHLYGISTGTPNISVVEPQDDYRTA